MRRKYCSERWKKLLDIAQKVDYIFGACNQLVVFSFLKRGVHDANWTRLGLSQGVRIDLGLKIRANGKEIPWLDAPEWFQVRVYLVIFIG
jgi:hypothetical protein